jgi:hypothetical protein
MTKVLEEADGLGLEMYLQSSDDGKWLYEKMGFQSMKDVISDLMSSAVVGSFLIQ